MRANYKRGKIRSIHVSLMSAGSKVGNTRACFQKRRSFLIEILRSGHSYTISLYYILEHYKIVFLFEGAQLQVGTKDDVQPSDQKGLQHGHQDGDAEADHASL